MSSTEGVRSGHTPVSNSLTDMDWPKVKESHQQRPSSETRDESAPADNGRENLPIPELLMTAELRKAVAPDTSGLQDIARASFGKAFPTAETVQGPDDRVEVQASNTYPWSAHASLLITAADGSNWIGTGWFVGPRTLITAGHVVYIHNPNNPATNGWVKRIVVMPGRNGSSLPFGAVTSTEFRSVSGWTERGDESYDYAAIILPTTLGNSTGWLGFGSYTDEEIRASEANISGYPGDKPSGTQWYHSRPVADVNNRKVFYSTDTAGGQSGSAVYRTVNGGRYAFAIHAYGGATNNSGTRINKAVYDNIVAWNVI